MHSPGLFSSLATIITNIDVGVYNKVGLIKSNMYKAVLQGCTVVIIQISVN